MKMEKIAYELQTDPSEKNVKRLGPRALVAFLEQVRDLYDERSEFPLIDLEQEEGVPRFLYFVGDVHGDLVTAKKIVKKFKNIKAGIHKKGSGVDLKLIFLGDYVDRAPKTIPNGGLLTALFLIASKVRLPDDIFLLRGNHEAIDLLTFSPYELPREIYDLFGEDESENVHDALLDVFSRLPLFLRTDNGLIASHAAFPKGRGTDLKNIEFEDEEDILHTIWGDPVETDTYRGDISRRANFTRKDLEEFLDDANANVLLRGHDYKTLGQSMYGGRMFTLFSSTRYEKRGEGGILMARAIMHPDVRIRSTSDIAIMDYSGESFVRRTA